MVLRSDPGCAHVDISLVSVVFLQVRCFLCFFRDFHCDCFLRNTKQFVVVILRGQSVDIWMLCYIFFDVVPLLEFRIVDLVYENRYN